VVFVPVAASERAVVNRTSTEHCNAIDLNNIDNLLVEVIFKYDMSLRCSFYCYYLVTWSHVYVLYSNHCTIKNYFAILDDRISLPGCDHTYM